MQQECKSWKKSRNLVAPCAVCCPLDHEQYLADITNSVQLSVGEGLLKILMICVFVPGYLSYFFSLSLNAGRR